MTREVRSDSVLALGRRLAVSCVWGFVPFALAVRYFRWT